MSHETSKANAELEKQRYRIHELEAANKLLNAGFQDLGHTCDRLRAEFETERMANKGRAEANAKLERELTQARMALSSVSGANQGNFKATQQAFKHVEDLKAELAGIKQCVMNAISRTGVLQVPAESAEAKEEYIRYCNECRGPVPQKDRRTYFKDLVEGEPFYHDGHRFFKTVRVPTGVSVRHPGGTGFTNTIQASDGSVSGMGDLVEVVQLSCGENRAA
jgi:hypothetical protein